MKSCAIWSPVHPVQLVMGFIVWSLWFVAAYAGLSVACSLAPPPSVSAWTWINLLLLGLTLIITALLLACAWRCWRAAASLPERDLRQGLGGQQPVDQQPQTGKSINRASTPTVGTTAQIRESEPEPKALRQQVESTRSNSPMPDIKGNHHFVARLSAGAYLFAALSTLAVGLPLLALPPCL